MAPNKNHPLNSLPETSVVVRALPNFLPDVHGMIKKIFRDEKFCDMELVSTDETYKVNTHRLILSAASPYFMNLFSQTKSKNKSRYSKRYKMTNMSGRCLKIIVDFIYYSSLPLKHNTVEDILKGAKSLQMDSLVELCSDFIGNLVTPFNCIGIRLFAMCYDLRKLFEFTEDYIFKNILKVRNGVEFLRLGVDQLIEFISSDKLCLDSEEDVFHTVMIWVDHNRDDRKIHIERLLQHVRLLLLSPEFITNVVKPVCQNEVIYRVLYKLMKWHCLPDFRSIPTVFPDSYLKLRKFTKVIIAISGWDLVDGNLQVGSYYSGKDEWIHKEWPQPRKLRYNFSFTTLNDKLIIGGGILLNKYYTNAVECLDMRSLMWSDMPSMSKKRKNFKMVTINGEIFAIGGDRPLTVLETIEKWNPKRNDWKHLTTLRQPIDEDAQVCAGSNVLCISQKQKKVNDTDILNFLHSIYYPDDDVWDYDWLITEEEIIGTAIWNCFTTYLIVVTREGIKKYKVEDKSCQDLESGAISYKYTGCRLFGDRLICYGTNEFKEFNLITNEWKTMPKLRNYNGESYVVSI